MHDKISLKEALSEASRVAEAFRNARKNADEVALLRDEIARLRAENDRLRAGRLQAETVNFIRHELFLQWNHAEDAEEEVDAVVADLDRCYPPDEV